MDDIVSYKVISERYLPNGNKRVATKLGKYGGYSIEEITMGACGPELVSYREAVQAPDRFIFKYHEGNYIYNAIMPKSTQGKFSINDGNLSIRGIINKADGCAIQLENLSIATNPELPFIKQNLLADGIISKETFLLLDNLLKNAGKGGQKLQNLTKYVIKKILGTAKA